MNPAEIENTRLQYVRLTNNLPFAFTDRYDGVPVTVKPGASENFSQEMANHFFGPSLDPAAMMRHVAKRQGWNTPDFVKINDATGKNKAEEYFDLLKIEPVAYKLVPVQDDLDPHEPIAADPLPPSEVPAPTKQSGRSRAQQRA